MSGHGPLKSLIPRVCPGILSCYEWQSHRWGDFTDRCDIEDLCSDCPPTLLTHFRGDEQRQPRISVADAIRLLVRQTGQSRWKDDMDVVPALPYLCGHCSNDSACSVELSPWSHSLPRSNGCFSGSPDLFVGPSRKQVEPVMRSEEAFCLKPKQLPLAPRVPRL